MMESVLRGVRRHFASFGAWTSANSKSDQQFALRETKALLILPAFMTLSSRGPGHRPFTAVTRVRIPLGSYRVHAELKKRD